MQGVRSAACRRTQSCDPCTDEVLHVWQVLANIVAKVFWSWAAREREERDSSQRPSREWGFPGDR